MDAGFMPGLCYPMAGKESSGSARILAKWCRLPREMAKRDIAPTMSPDGRTLAFVRETTSMGYFGIVQIATVPAGASEPLAEPTIVDADRFVHGGLAWAPSGKELLFCTGKLASQPARILYRVTLAKPARRTRVLSDYCQTLAISRPASDGTAQLMYGTYHARSEIFRLPLDGKST